MQNAPQRTYFISDTYGGTGEDWNPLAQDDADVLISTDFGGRPLSPIHREFDHFGQEEVSAHILRLILAQHDELLSRLDLTPEQKQQAINLGTGIFINSAPRTGRNNAEPFYLATARNGAIRIVTTPLGALSPVKHEIESLSYLENPTDPAGSNGLYGGREQFRSRLTPRLLDPHHNLQLEGADVRSIPEGRKDWHVSYVDRFGNVITRTENPVEQWAEIARVAKTMQEENGRVRLIITGKDHTHPTTPLEIAHSLGEATPGVPSIYGNSGGIDVVVKWMEGQDATDRLSGSAWNVLGKPKIGASIKLVKKD